MVSVPLEVTWVKSGPAAIGGAKNTSIAQLAVGARVPQLWVRENAAPETETPDTLITRTLSFVTVTRWAGERVPIDWMPKSTAPGETASDPTGGLAPVT